jgi:hypothetical protein
MKAGQKIQVKKSAKYSGKDMAWSETFTGNVRLQEPTRFLHTSSSPIKSFAPVETCFSMPDILDNCLSLSNDTDRTKYGTGAEMGRKYCYVITLPAGTEVATFSNDEIRIELTEGMELTYIGYYNFLFLDTPFERQVSNPRQERFVKVINQYFLSEI